MHIQSAPRRPHNDVLWVWAELGIVGLGLYLWVLYSALRGRPHHGSWLVFRCVVLVIFVHGLFSFPREQAAPALLFWVAIGALHRGRGRSWPIPWTRALYAGLVVLGLAGGWVSVRAILFDREYAAALAAQGAGDTTEQIGHAGGAIGWGAFDHRVFITLGDGLFEQTDYEGSSEVYSRYTEVEPYLPAALNNLGQSLIAQNDYLGAEPYLRRGLQILSDDGYLRNNLAEALRRQERPTEALALFDDVASLSATDHHSLGVLKAEMDNLTEAEYHYETALQLDANLHEVIYSLAGIGLLEGRLDQAARGYERFLSVWTGQSAYVRRAKNRLRQIYPELARRYVVEARMVEAVDTYGRLVDLGGVDAETLHAYATVLARLGRVEQAIAVGRHVVETDGSFVPVYLTLGQLYEAAGNPGAAYQHYTIFLNRWEEPGPQRAVAEERRQALKQ